MSDIVAGHSLTDRTTVAIREVLAGRRRSPWSALLFAGPAVVASIAYMDPGNFATNIQAGAGFGDPLLWVVLLANLIAMLFQALSAKLGIVTGRNLAEMCREEFPLPAVYAMWAVSEVAAMATDLAEFLGGAIGLSLLFHTTLLTGMAATAIVTYGILMFQGRGFRPIELIIGGLVAAIGICYLIEMFIAPVNWSDATLHSVLPAMPNAAALTISVGIIGATVMPHAVYLHSGLTQHRVPARLRASGGSCWRLLQPRGDHRAVRCRLGQHDDGGDGVRSVPCRPQRGVRDRHRLSHRPRCWAAPPRRYS